RDGRGQHDERSAARLAAASGNGLAREVIERDRGEEQRHVTPAPPAVEVQRRKHEPSDGDTRAPADEDECARERDREKQEEERVRVEEHSAAAANAIAARAPSIFGVAMFVKAR